MNTQTVTFEWSTKHGRCYDCGLPAAFYLPRAYINETRNPNAPDQPPTDTNKRCSVCAANDAADGLVVRRIVDSESEQVDLNDFPYEVRIGYHRISDDSVSSGVWQPDPRRARYVSELIESDDIDQAWWRRLGVAGDEVHTIKGEPQ